MKRIATLLLSVLLLPALTGCAVSNGDYYQRAQLYLGSGDFQDAAELFSLLGEYEDSASYALYAAGLDALARGDLALARADMALIAPFKSSKLYLEYIDALMLEQEGELRSALEIFQALGSFEDSRTRAQSLLETVTQRELSRARALMGAARWEAALEILSGMADSPQVQELSLQCRQALTAAAYAHADALWDSGDYAGALAAFDALGDTLDSATRANACRSVLISRLEQEVHKARMSNARELMRRCREWPGDSRADALLNALQARFSVNLTLEDHAREHPLVQFGRCAQDDSGRNGPLLWQLLSLDDGRALLLCQQAVRGPSVILTQAEQAAALLDPPGETLLPDHFSLPDLPDPGLSSPEQRPVLLLDLNIFSLSAGSGTEADPYR